MNAPLMLYQCPTNLACRLPERYFYTKPHQHQARYSQLTSLNRITAGAFLQPEVLYYLHAGIALPEKPLPPPRSGEAQALVQGLQDLHLKDASGSNDVEGSTVGEDPTMQVPLVSCMLLIRLQPSA